MITTLEFILISFMCYSMYNFQPIQSGQQHNLNEAK